MPCYTSRTVSVAVEVANRDVLLRGLRAGGFTEVDLYGETISARTPQGQRFTLQGGEVRVTGSYVTRESAEAAATAVRVAYAEEGVRTMAKKYGWQVKTSPATPGLHTLTRRSF